MKKQGALIGVAGFCALGASLVAGGPLQNSGLESQPVLTRQVAVMRQQCLQSTRDAALSDLRKREEQLQREWCHATRDARRTEFAAAFVESLRRAEDGGGGRAKTVAEFLRKTPDAIKPLASYTGVCVDEKLRIDEALVAPVVDEPSVVGTLLGVNLNGKRVSRLNPVPRWNKLVKQGLVLRSPQMTYKVPFPMLSEAERSGAVQGAQTRSCPSSTELDAALTAPAGEPDPGRDPAATEMDARELVASMLADSYQRRRIGPLVQLAQASARLPGLSASCDKDLRARLTDEELARRVTVELVRLVNPRSLQRVVDVRRSAGMTPLFSTDGQLRLFHAEDDREQARVTDIYGTGRTAAFVVDAADVTVAATQAMALGLYSWSSARSDLIGLGCLPGRP